MTSSPSGAPSSPGLTGVITVRLTAAFKPSTVTVQAGQRILVEVSSAVQVRGPAFPGACPGTTQPVAGGMLSLRCTAGGYLFTAQRPGSASLSVTVRPRCSPGSMCPQWITTATLAISIA